MDRGVWVLSTLFFPHKASVILAILISTWFREDKLLCLGKRSCCGVGIKKGTFSIKLAYQMALSHIWLISNHSSSSAISGGFPWQPLWTMRLPNKIKLFMSKVCHGFLPCSELLFKREVMDRPCFVLCGRARESILHTLVQCCLGEKGLDTVPSWWISWRIFWPVRWVVQMEAVATMLWSIWNNHNRIIKEGHKTDGWGPRCCNLWYSTLRFWWICTPSYADFVKCPIGRLLTCMFSTAQSLFFLRDSNRSCSW